MQKRRVYYTPLQQTKKHHASLLSELFHDVRIEPTLQKLTGEQFEQRAANTLDEARLDEAARGLLAAVQIALF